MKHLLKRGVQLIKSLFLNGLFTLLPIIITTALFVFFFRLLVRWIEPIHHVVPHALQVIPFSEVILVILSIFIIGAIFKFLLFQPLLHFFESVLLKIPLVRPVYFGIKQLIQAFTVQDEMSFKQVVLTEFPRKGIYSIGFVTSESLPSLNPQEKTKFYHVYIPTTPNPTTGFFVIIPENELQVIDLTRQEAMTLVISGGIIQPERHLKK